MVTFHLQYTAIADAYPHYKKFFSCITRDSALAFYGTYPAPHHLDNVTVEQLAAFLHTASKGRLSGTKAEIILNHVKRDNVPKLEHQDAQDYTVKSLVRQVKNNLAELSGIDYEIEKMLVHFNYPLTSIKGIDTLTCAKIIAEVGDIRRFKSAKQLAKYSGISPVTYASGMTNLQRANARGNRKLNEIFFKIALTSVTPIGKNNVLVNPICYEYFQKKLSEGKTKNQAIKAVQRRLVNIVFSVMKYNRPYENPEIRYLTKDTASA